MVTAKERPPARSWRGSAKYAARAAGKWRRLGHRGWGSAVQDVGAHGAVRGVEHREGRASHQIAIGEIAAEQAFRAVVSVLMPRDADDGPVKPATPFDADELEPN